MPITQQQNESDAVKIARDKERTKRFTLYIGALSLVAIFGIYFVFKAGKGSINFGKDGVKVEIDKPIVAQVGVTTSEYKTSKGNIPFTTGSVNPEVIQKLQDQNVSISSASFTGENYINREAGFLFSVSHPNNWSIQYNSSGNDQPINTFTSADGSQFMVGIEQLPMQMTIENYIKIALNNLLQAGTIQEMPLVEYDFPSNTAFLYYHNLGNGSEIYQKIIIKGNKAFGAGVKYFEGSSNDIIAADLLQMISTFTLIGD